MKLNQNIGYGNDIFYQKRNVDNILQTFIQRKTKERIQFVENVFFISGISYIFEIFICQIRSIRKHVFLVLKKCIGIMKSSVN